MTDNQDSVTAGAVQPPTERPLTAGDVPLLREGDVLRIDTGGTLHTFSHAKQGGRVIGIKQGSSLKYYAPFRFTFVSRPALQESLIWALSELRGDTHYKNDQQRQNCFDLADAALASPPVSERERELEGALAKAVVFNAYRAEDPLAIRLEFVTEEDRLAAANAIDRLTAQPQEPV